jgi:transcriptional regulator with XRE-family HTH domain
MATDIELAQRMSAWRAHRGLTLQRVATASGTSKQKISYVELGEQNISVEMLNRICTKAFKIDLATFFGPLPKKQERAA